MLYLSKKNLKPSSYTRIELCDKNDFNGLFGLYKQFVIDQWNYETNIVPSDDEISDMLNDMLSDKKQKVYIKKVGSEIAGFVNTIDYDNLVMVNELFISPKFRRKGFALNFLKAVESTCRSNELMIKVHDNNFGAINCYHKFGFKEC